VLDKSGWPVVDYRLSAYDRGHMLAGIRKAFEIHRAAGAKQVIFPHAQRHSYNIMTSKMSAEAFLERMPKWGWGANQAAVFTAHQMGSCAMGGDAGRHPVDPTGQVRGVQGLFVADGSLLPTAAGVNPMMTIMAMADHVVQGLVEAGR
jgi:choline dehydrogenase-like flavoprotein